MFHTFSQIQALSKARIGQYTKDPNFSRYRGSATYFAQVPKEVAEAQAENKENNTVRLEDELGDIFRDYTCLLSALKAEWKITNIENVFKRCYKKFSERINADWTNNSTREEVKAKQKAELKKEHDLLYPPVS